MANPKNFNVESKIRYIVEEQWRPDADYRFLNWAQANVALDGIKRPTIVYILPPSGTLMHRWNQTTDRPQSQVAFLCNTRFDFHARENDRLMVAMKRLAATFVRELNKSGMFEQIPDKTEIPYQAVYDMLDQNVTGVIITLDLREIDGEKFCEQ